MNFNFPEGLEYALCDGMLFPPGIVLDVEPFSYGRPSEAKLRKDLGAGKAR